MKTKKERWIVLAITTLFLAGSLASAQELTGEEILEKIKGKISLTGSGMATIKLIMENERGEQGSNTIKVYRKASEKIEKQLIKYLEPADVKGTKLLSIVEEGKENMWLYLPALGKEKRIVGQRKKVLLWVRTLLLKKLGVAKATRKNIVLKDWRMKSLKITLAMFSNLIPKKKELNIPILRCGSGKRSFFL